MLFGVPPVRAKKARQYADPQLQCRVIAPPQPSPDQNVQLTPDDGSGIAPMLPGAKRNHWSDGYGLIAFDTDACIQHTGFIFNQNSASKLIRSRLSQSLGWLIPPPTKIFGLNR